MIIIVFGLPGSGKSYFASKLAERIESGYLSSDKLRKELFQLRTYTEEEKEIVYTAMFNKAKEMVKNRRDIVMDATFYRNSLRRKVQDEIAKEETVKWIEVKANESLIRKRLEKPRMESDANYNVYLKLKEEWEPINNDHLILESTDENLETMLNIAIHYLNMPDDRK